MPSESRTVFKPQNGKLRASRNAPLYCSRCLAEPKRGASLSVCAGCKRARYCSPQHQKDDWPSHKYHCQLDRQQHDAFLALPRPQHRRLQSLHRMKYMLEDFINLHKRSLHVAVDSLITSSNNNNNNATRSRARPIDCRTHCAAIDVSFHPLAGGPANNVNPALAFALANFRFAPDPEDDAGKFRLLRSGIQARDAQCRGTPGYFGIIPCVVHLDSLPVWAGAQRILTATVPAHVGKASQVVALLKYTVEKGVVHRLADERGARHWYSGLLHPRGENWVWKKETSEEFGKCGLDVSQILWP